MLLEGRRNIVLHGFKCLSNDKGQIHTGIISKETQLNIILIIILVPLFDFLYLRNLK